MEEKNKIKILLFDKYQEKISEDIVSKNRIGLEANLLVKDFHSDYDMHMAPYSHSAMISAIRIEKYKKIITSFQKLGKPYKKQIKILKKKISREAKILHKSGLIIERMKQRYCLINIQIKELNYEEKEDGSSCFLSAFIIFLIFSGTRILYLLGVFKYLKPF